MQICWTISIATPLIYSWLIKPAFLEKILLIVALLLISLLFLNYSKGLFKDSYVSRKNIKYSNSIVNGETFFCVYNNLSAAMLRLLSNCLNKFCLFLKQ